MRRRPLDELAVEMHDLLVKGFPASMRGRRLVRSEVIPEGQVYYAMGEYFVGPLTFWSFTHNFRYPMLSVYSRGMIELERDRRRRSKR